jgi:hypothetical protein
MAPTPTPTPKPRKKKSMGHARRRPIHVHLPRNAERIGSKTAENDVADIDADAAADVARKTFLFT